MMRNHSHPVSGVLALGIALSAAACSLAVDAGREQCVSNDDCARLGPEFASSTCESSLCRARTDPNWVCLDEATNVAALRIPDVVRIIVPLVNVVTEEQVPGVEVQACERLDADCLSPRASGVSNDAGEVELRVPGGFNGYLRWQSDSIYPTMFFFGLPIVVDAIVPVNVITPMAFEGLNAQFRGAAIEGRSAVVVNVMNCNGEPAAGVSLAVAEGDASTRVYYMVDGLFPPSQTETTSAGLARLVNVPQGNVSINGTLADGRHMGTAAVLTQPGFATITNLRPASISSQP